MICCSGGGSNRIGHFFSGSVIVEDNEALEPDFLEAIFMPWALSKAGVYLKFMKHCMYSMYGFYNVN